MTNDMLVQAFCSTSGRYVVHMSYLYNMSYVQHLIELNAVLAHRSPQSGPQYIARAFLVVP